jgi:hypothetical protein
MCEISSLDCNVANSETVVVPKDFRDNPEDF